MSRHAIRVLVIALLTAVALVGVIVLVAMGQAEGTAFGVLTGVLGTMLPALMDSLAVEVRRRDPRQSAIEDDVKPPRNMRETRRGHAPAPAHSPSDSDEE